MTLPVGRRLLRSVAGPGSKLSFAAASAAMVTVFGAAGRFALQVAIEGLLGQSVYGRFVALRGWGELAATVPNRGYHGATVRFLPEYETTGRWRLYRGLIRRSLTLTVGGGIVLCVLAAAVALYLVEDSRTAILLTAATIPAWAVMRMLQAVLQAQHQFVAATFITQLVQPGLVGVGLIFIWLTSYKLDLESALAILLGSILIAVVAEAVTSWMSAPPAAASVPGVEVDRTPWEATARALFGSQLAIAVIGMADVLILAMFVSADEVALYSIASRIAVLGRMVNSGLESIVSPRIAASWGKRSIEGIQRSVENSIALSTVPTVLIALFLVIFRGPVLAIVGEEYREAGIVLVILLLGNVINALTGPSGYVVSLTDNEKVYARIMTATAVGLVVGCFLVAGQWGIVGVASVRTISNISWNAALVKFAYDKLGVRCFPTMDLLRRGLGRIRQ